LFHFIFIIIAMHRFITVTAAMLHHHTVTVTSPPRPGTDV
jgi:hypothetical protein